MRRREADTKGGWKVLFRAIRPICFGAFALCGGLPVWSAGVESPAVSIRAGEALANRHCATCHQLPTPELLTKKSWEFCLTYMGFFLGRADYTPLQGCDADVMEIIRAREQFVREAKMFPANPLITEEEWRALRAYYVHHAPEEPLAQAPRPSVAVDDTLFLPRPVQYRARPALTSMVRIDAENRLILVHDGLAEKLTVLSGRGEWLDEHQAPGVVLVDMVRTDDGLYLLNIGDLFASSVGKGFGELQYARQIGSTLFGLRVLLKGLHRPCDVELADLNGDGVDEALISNFGDYSGDVSLYRASGDERHFLPEPAILSPQPGVVKTAAFDFTGDGLVDVAVLASAARENLSIFVNRGLGSFERHVIVERHPSFGYTGMELRDFDGDGRMDILTINGDNGDSDPYNTLKRDHGIRIHLNQGGLDFTEDFFFPMYGVFGVEVADFDLDGDLDIAAIAFHPDFDQRPRGFFVLLEQVGPLTFQPKTHPATFDGRWMTMDSGDLDGDGDVDLVLGAGYAPVGMRGRHRALYEEMLESGPPLLLLENQARR